MQTERNASNSANCANSNFNLPATVFITFVCAADPTRDTEIPTLIAGRIPELNKSFDKKICPSVIEITFVGI